MYQIAPPLLPNQDLKIDNEGWLQVWLQISEKLNEISDLNGWGARTRTLYRAEISADVSRRRAEDSAEVAEFSGDPASGQCGAVRRFAEVAVLPVATVARVGEFAAGLERDEFEAVVEFWDLVVPRS